MYKKIKKFLFKKFFHYPKFWKNINIISILLLPFTLITKLTIKFRKLFFNLLYSPNQPIICVGNITVGGSGKTPVIIQLSKELLKKNYKIAVISKGYGSKLSSPYVIISDSLKLTEEFYPDEALEIFEELKSLGTSHLSYVVIVAKNVQDTHKIIYHFSPDVILVDDGMQNPAFKKDYKILCVDSERGFGNELLLPAGPLRQSLNSSIKEINSVILSPNNNKSMPHDSVNNYLLKLPKNIPVFTSEYKISSYIDKEKFYYAFTSISNPEKFFNFLKENDFHIVGEEKFPDHHIYSKKDLLSLSEKSMQAEANMLITTFKDYVKCYKNLPITKILALKIDLYISNIDQIIADIEKLIEKK